MTLQYILVDGKPVEEPDTLKWGKWFEEADRTVLRDKFQDGTEISTVFLGIDHAFGNGDPVLYETMIFGGVHDGHQMRYHTEAEARIGHAKCVNLAADGDGEVGN